MSRTEPVQAALSALAPRLVAGATGVDGLHRLSGGAMQEIWRFDLVTAARREALILRRAPGGMPKSVPESVPKSVPENVLESVPMPQAGITLQAEAAIMQRVEECGVPVPAIRHVLAPGDGLGEGFVMPFIDGETLGGRIVKAERFAAIRPRLAWQCGEILARIHGADLAVLPPLPGGDARSLVAQWREAYRACAWPRPVFDAAFAWLTRHDPGSAARRCLVHGDFRNGNLIIGEDGVRAVLDWELAHAGDPVEDLGWLCGNSWRFGRPDRVVGGFGDMADLLAGYHSGSGIMVPPGALAWWQVFGTLRWGVMCAGMVAMFRGADPSAERAVICRRASETEIDLLTLLAA